MELIKALKDTRQQKTYMPIYEIAGSIREALAKEEIDYLIKELQDGTNN